MADTKIEIQHIYRGSPCTLHKRSADLATGEATPWEPCTPEEQAKLEADSAKASKAAEKKHK